MSENQPEMMQALLARGVDVNLEQFDGYTPLVEAILNDAPAEVIALLLKAGADVNLVDHFETAPLGQAVGKKASNAVFDMLIEAGADVFAVDQFGNTAMHVAASQSDNIRLVERLLAQGANINDMDFERVTPLHMAASMGGGDMIERMLALGANPAIPNVEGEYAYARAKYSVLVADSPMLEVLRQAVTPPPQALAICLDWGKAVFWQGITLQKVEACLPFRDVNIIGFARKMPMMWALEQPDVDIAAIRALLSVGVELNMGDMMGRTALHYAVSAGRADLVALLLYRGSNPNAQDEAGQTPLSLNAALNGDPSIRRILLESGATP